jgi:hypothetical protein
MSREESDREDLLREATALVARVEFGFVGEIEPIVAGFRRDGAASFYFCGYPVVQFDLERRVRRGYYRGVLVKAESGKLVTLKRHRTATETQLLRQEWTEEQARAYLWEMRDRLAGLRQHLDSGTAHIVGAVPSENDVVPRLREWLDALPIELEIAASAGLK